MIIYNPDRYLTGKEIRQMRNHELVLVNRIAINSQITKLQLQPSSDKNKKALEILLEESRELRQKEKEKHKTYWGTVMMVRDIKIAFGKSLDKMSRTYFRRLS